GPGGELAARGPAGGPAGPLRRGARQPALRRRRRARRAGAGGCPPRAGAGVVRRRRRAGREPCADRVPSPTPARPACRARGGRRPGTGGGRTDARRRLSRGGCRARPGWNRAGGGGEAAGGVSGVLGSTEASALEECIAAGGVAVIPTDTVY